MSRTCALPGCGVEFEPANDSQKYHAAKCRAAAAREKALNGLPGKITGGPRKNKRGVSITLLFTNEDDAVRALALNPGETVHVYHAATNAANSK